MKDSNIEWIGIMPKKWGMKPLKAILQERKENNSPIKTDNILSLTIDKGVIPYSEKESGGNKAKEDLTAYKLAYPNDIVLNSMNVIAGAVGLSKYFGAVSPVYYMLYTRNTEDSIEYYNYIFQTKVFQDSLIGLGNGIMVKQSESSGKLNTIRMRIPMLKLNTVNIPCPPYKEQQLIVNYLNEKVTKIDNIISQATISIEEYKKYKQCLITETVTKGLNPDVKLRGSGIEYIDKIPSHWGIRKIKQALTVLERKVLESDEVITCFRNGEVTLRKNRREEGYTFSDTEKNYQGVEIGDLVIHGMDAFAGAIGISDSRGKCTPVVHVCDSKENKKFYMYFLRALAFNDVFMALSDGIRIRSSDFRNWDKLARIMVVVPTRQEQREIAEYLDNKCCKIDKLIGQKNQLIEEMKAYKKSLIYECVTGKREVK